MTIRLLAATLSCLCFTVVGRAADEVKEIELKDFKPTGRPMTTIDKPTEIKSAEELEKTFPAKETVDAIKKEVDFGKQKLLFFAWSGSGQDKISAGGFKDGTATFNYKRGLTRDLRPHFHLFVVPKDAKWTMGKGN